MGQDCLRGLTSQFASPQLLHRRRGCANGGSDALISPDESAVMVDAQYSLITHIRVTHISAKLRRIPVGFYVTVISENGTQRTSNKPAVVGKDVVEWDDEILLPSEHLSKISLTVLASFELGSTLGGGEVVREVDVIVGELLDPRSESEIIRLSEQDDGNVEIKIRTISGPGKYAAVSNPTASDEMRRIEELTDMGRHALVRYCEVQEQRVLDESIRHFEQARDLCPPGHLSRATVLLNLANAKMMDCRMNDVSPDLDTPINLYRTALSLHSRDHPNYTFTLLSLGVGLKARFQRQAGETDKAEGDTLLSQLLDLSQPNSYVYQAAILALNSAANTELLPRRETPHTTEDSDDDDEEQEEEEEEEEEEEKVDRLDAILQWIFYPDSSRPVLLDPLGILFCVRLDWVASLIDRERVISVLEVVAQYTSDDHPHKPVWLVHLALSLWNRYECFGDVLDLDKSISLEEDVVQLTPDGHPDKPTRLVNLAVSLSDRYERFDDVMDLEKSISLKEDAVRLTPDGHPDKTLWLSNLARSLSSRYEHFGNVVDLEKSISLKGDVVQLTPDGHPDKPTRLANLASSLWTRHKRFGNVVDLEKSISLKEDVVELTPDGHPDKPRRLSSLASSLWSRYERFGNIVDLEKSMSFQEDAVQLTPDGHPDKPRRLGNLAFSLRSRYERFGDIMDLKKSISLQEDAVQLTPDGHPDKPLRLSNLARSLSSRYERFGEIVDLKKSTSLHEDAVQLTPDGHPDKPQRVSNLASLLWSRYERFGDIADLEKSISLQGDAVQLTPDGHTDKPTRLENLASSLSSRHERFGDTVDLKKSISLQEDAVQLTPDSHTDKPRRVGNLASLLWNRYERLGDMADLEKSISLREDAVQLTPDGHPDKPIRLDNFAVSLRSRFERFGDIVDLKKSISLEEDAMQLTSDGHPDKPLRIGNLACLLSSRYEHSEDIVDLKKSISLEEDAVQLTPDGHPDKPRRLHNLAVSLSRRYQLFGDIVDLKQSISLGENAVRLTPDGHQQKPPRLQHTAHLLLQSFQRFGELSSPDLRRAISYSSRAAHSYTGQVSVRFQSSQLWIQCLRLLPQETQSLFGAYTIAVDLLPQLAWIALSFQDRYHQLLQAVGVVSDAAAGALDLHRPELAIEWLEQGRSIMWSQVSQLRTPVDDLHSIHPALATQFERVSHELEHAGVRCMDDFTNHMHTTDGLLEKQAGQHHELAWSRETLLAEIRALPGFERFLLPKTIDQLSSLAHTGHVILLNASEQRCDALVVTAASKNVVHVPLSHTSYAEIANMRRQLSGLLRYHGRTIPRDEIDREGGASLPVRLGPDDVFESILSRLWNDVVSPILVVLGLSTPPAELSRIFWCPTGPFTLLPIHAAGIYDTTNRGPKLSEFVISSYIPTMTALEKPPQQDSLTTSGKVRFLAIPQPSTGGGLPLNGVKEEMGFMRELTSSSPFVDFQEADGSIEDVLAKMKESDWVHFCCHGTQDRTNPLDSGLLLAERKRLKLSDIIQLSRPRGGLAFLSACQTAMGDEKLSDEAIHLAAGMLLAGYSGVIATMWSIMDSDAPRVTKDVYTSLLGDRRAPDSGRAAEALHRAIERLRESSAPFLSWVPFVHYGL